MHSGPVKHCVARSSAVAVRAAQLLTRVAQMLQQRAARKQQQRAARKQQQRTAHHYARAFLPVPRPQPGPGPGKLNPAWADEWPGHSTASDLDRTVVLAFRANKTGTSGLIVKP